MEKPIEEELVAVEQWIQLMGKRKNHVEVRRVNDLSPAFVHPDFLIDRLAAGAIAVFAGIVVEFQVSAVWALGDADAEFPGFTGHDGTGGLALNLGLDRSGAAILGVGIVPYPLYFQVMHGSSPPSGRRG